MRGPGLLTRFLPEEMRPLPRIQPASGMTLEPLIREIPISIIRLYLHDSGGVARGRDVLVVGRECLGRQLAQHLRERQADGRGVVFRVVHLVWGVGFGVWGLRLIDVCIPQL